MNARTQIFELSVEGRQVDEAVASIFHTVLFHRSLGKFRYKQEGSYSVGTVGYLDVDCDFIDFTYVCCASENLDKNLKKEISDFSEALRGNDGHGSGQISLEFFQKKKSRWPFQAESIPWEVWTVRIELITLNNEHERQLRREQVGDMLAEKILYIAEVMNKHEYVPKMPNQSELDLIFDTSYPDVQPYLFKLKEEEEDIDIDLRTPEIEECQQTSSSASYYCCDTYSNQDAVKKKNRPLYYVLHLMKRLI